MSRGLGERRHPGGNLGRAVVQIDCSTVLPAGLEVCRQLPGDGIEVGSGVELDGLGDPVVKQTSPGGVDLAVGNIADPVVAQVVAVRPTLADQPPLPELVQGGSDLRFVKVARHGQGVEWNVASPRRREL